jgi:hypothetical protein
VNVQEYTCSRNLGISMRVLISESIQRVQFIAVHVSGFSKYDDELTVDNNEGLNEIRLDVNQKTWLDGQY